MEFVRARLRVSLVLCAVALLGPAAATAGELYTAGQMRISSATGASSGATPLFSNSGSDSDSSPAYGATFGISYAFDEMIPAEDILPGWKARFEFEGLYGRDYELRTQGADPYFNEVSAWTVMGNLWLDIPLDYPISWAFGRMPILEPLSFYLGAGVGLGGVDVSVTDNASRGSEEMLGFVYQAGAGFGYALTEYATLSMGYRYLDLGSADVSLRSAGQPFGNISLDLTAHEFTSGVRFHFYAVPFPGDEGRRRRFR